MVRVGATLTGPQERTSVTMRTIMLMRILVGIIMVVIMIIIRGPAGDDNAMQEEQQGRRLWFSADI